MMVGINKNCVAVPVVITHSPGNGLMTLMSHYPLPDFCLCPSCFHSHYMCVYLALYVP